jgi:hypothetical protein
MFGFYIERRPPRARECRWREPPLAPGKKGRLTVRTWPIGSQCARRTRYLAVSVANPSMSTR